MYLGVHLFVSPLARRSWQLILDKFKNYVNHWAFRCLSFIGRIMFLKAMVQELPLYRCMVQVALESFIRELDALSRQFLWSGSLDSKKWSLVRWETICRPIHQGGLVLCQAGLTGQALVAKLYWRWCVFQDQSWAKILKAKYLRGAMARDIPHYPLEGKESMIWDTLR